MDRIVKLLDILKLEVAVYVPPLIVKFLNAFDGSELIFPVPDNLTLELPAYVKVPVSSSQFPETSISAPVPLRFRVPFTSMFPLTSNLTPAFIWTEVPASITKLASEVFAVRIG